MTPQQRLQAVCLDALGKTAILAESKRYVGYEMHVGVVIRALPNQPP